MKCIYCGIEITDENKGLNIPFPNICLSCIRKKNKRQKLLQPWVIKGINKNY